ncbi:MAG: gluconokinase [Thermomicrobiales bacterium]
MTSSYEGTEAPYVLAIDMGTSSTRALIFDRMGRAIADTETQLPYDIHATEDGGVEIDPALLLKHTAACVDGAVAAASERQVPISLVAVSCFWHSLMGLDAEMRPITPIYMWGDTRARFAAADIRAENDVEAYRQECGVTVHSSYWPSKLRWLQETNPGVVGRVVRWTSAADYLSLIWQGVDHVSMPMASGTGLLNIQTGEWSDRAIEIARINRSTLPPIVPREAASVGLTSDWAERWPLLAGVPWYPAIGDGACANVGSGAVGRSRLALTLGTSGAVRGVIEAPLSEHYVVPPDVWAYRLDSRHLVIGAAVSNGGNVAAWMAALTGLPIADESLGAFLDVEADSHGLTILPFLSGERAPLWNDSVTAVVAGLTLAADPERLQRAAMESVSVRLAMLYRLVLPQMAEPCAVIANGGALLSSETWQEITCDALGTPLTILEPTEETGARGAAVLALEAIGAIPAIDAGTDPATGRPVRNPNLDRHERYLRASDRQERLTNAMLQSGLWDLDRRST